MRMMMIVIIDVELFETNQGNGSSFQELPTYENATFFIMIKIGLDQVLYK